MTDLLHLGNPDGVLLKDEKKGKEAYNDKILRYNSRYAQLIAKQKTNLEEINHVLSILPQQKLIGIIQRDIHELHQKQLQFLAEF